MSTQNINSPSVVGVFLAFVVLVAVVILLASTIHSTLRRHQVRRRDSQRFKVAEEARRDFR